MRTKTKTARSHWAADRRLEFIDSRLRWDGLFERWDVVAAFGVSFRQVSADVAAYCVLAPKNVRYDRSENCYVATDGFEPQFETSSSANYLSDLVAIETGVAAYWQNSFAWMPAIETNTLKLRAINEAAMTAMVRGVRSGRAVHVSYLSNEAIKPLRWSLSPQAFFNDGNKWYVRAYHPPSGTFMDFALARVLKARLSKEDETPSVFDAAWENVLQVVLVANPALGPEQRQCIEYEYRMKSHKLIVPCRQSLLPYLLARFGVDEEQVKNSRRPLLIGNRTELSAKRTDEQSYRRCP